MRSSNIFPKAILSALVFATCARALDTSRPLSEFSHDSWGIDQGFSWGTVYAIAQTSDGYLWIGTEAGLVRFDGRSFRAIDHKSAPGLPPGRVLGLLADNENDLWIRLATEGLFRYRNGVITDMVASRDDRLITAMYLRANGAPIFESTRGVSLTYERGVIKTIPLAVHAGASVTAIAETADGTLWYGTRDDGLFYQRRPEEGILRTTLRSAKINCLAPIGNRELWIGTNSGVFRWDGNASGDHSLHLAMRNAEALSMIADREGNVWVGSSKGLLRMSPRSGVAALDSQRGKAQSVNVLFEDREGDIWFGGPNGLERLREDAFVTYSSAAQQDDMSGPLYADSAGHLWFAPLSGGLYWRQNLSVQHIKNRSLDQDVIYSIGGDQNEIWVGRQHGGLTRLLTGNWRDSQTYTASQGLAAGSVYCVHRGRDGSVWAGTIGGGLSRLKNGVFQTFTASDGLASNSVTAIEESVDGTMWFATSSGLSAFSKGKWRRYTSDDGLPPHDIISLAADGPILWIGTSQGLAFLRQDHITALYNAPLLDEPIVGIAPTPIRDKYPASLWIATEQSVLRVNRERLLAGKVDRADIRIFDAVDGMRGTGNMRRDRSVITDPLGRIWFSTNRGVAVVDPLALARYSVPVIVHIQTVAADGNILRDRDELDGGALVRVPAAPHRVVFSYIGLRLSEPARVLFKYRLDGYDTTWSDATTARDAAYTNLAPGTYHFRVMASSADGTWSPEEAATAVSIAPLYWQTWWFRSLAGLALAVIAILFYRFRTHQLTTELNVRFEERLQERTRIARELHDTLLQGFLSASMKLEVALDRVPEDSPLRPVLDGVLGLMRRVIDEGRDTVRGLRLPDAQSGYLEDAFCQVNEEVNGSQDTEFRVVVDGDRWPLNAVLRDEIYRIGREALVNAFRHSGAKLVEVELDYSHNSFAMRVRDDGRGIDPAVLREGRQGHWGLQGMRERAEQIGGRLTLWSGASAGTELVLIVPRSIAYSTPQMRQSGKGWRRA